MSNDLVSYYKYLISNMLKQLDYIEKFGIDQSDINIKKSIESMGNCINNIYNEMKNMGIDIDNLLNESYDIQSNIRDFKIKRIRENEGN